jgi:hypothetical protein
VNMMNGRGLGSKRSWPDLRYYAGIRLEGLRKSTKNLIRHSRTPGRDSNPGRHGHEAGVLTTRPRRSVTTVGKMYVHCLASCGSCLPLLLDIEPRVGDTQHRLI